MHVAAALSNLEAAITIRSAETQLHCAAASWKFQTGFWHWKKTRCSPRTQMLTRMLMLQMPKHMDMQSRRRLFCNSWFEHSCTYIFPLLPVCSVEWKE
jgi:hypothetical protein